MDVTKHPRHGRQTPEETCDMLRSHTPATLEQIGTVQTADRAARRSMHAVGLVVIRKGGTQCERGVDTTWCEQRIDSRSDSQRRFELRRIDRNRSATNALAIVAGPMNRGRWRFGRHAFRLPRRAAGVAARRCQVGNLGICHSAVCPAYTLLAHQWTGQQRGNHQRV
jgi:hypothetical protein